MISALYLRFVRMGKIQVNEILNEASIQTYVK